MKFKAPCFVRIKDPCKRKELIAWLNNIGYDCSTAHTDEVYYGKTEPVFIVVNSGHCRIQHNRPMLIEEHDCCTDIDLFKALAAMNDENDREQWFVNDTYANIGCELWHLCEEKTFKHYYVDWEDGATDLRCDFRKATAKEVVEHFKTTHL